MSINSNIETGSPSKYAPYVFTVTLRDVCALDTIDITSPINDLTYNIGQGSILITPSYMQEYTECSTQYGVLLDESGVDTALTPAQQAFLILDGNSGTLTIDTDDSSLHDVILTVKLFMESMESIQDPGQYGINQFDITFYDPCTIDEITATGDIPDFTYLISRGQEDIFPEYAQADPQCEVSYSIMLIVGNVPTALTSSEQQYMILNTSTG